METLVVVASLVSYVIVGVVFSGLVHRLDGPRTHIDGWAPAAALFWPLGVVVAIIIGYAVILRRLWYICSGWPEPRGEP